MHVFLVLHLVLIILYKRPYQRTRKEVFKIGFIHKTCTLYIIIEYLFNIIKDGGIIEGIDKILLRTKYNIGSILIMFQTHQTH